VNAAVALYRERYAAVGMFENRVYRGVHEMLDQLTCAGMRLLVATSKPTVYAVPIVRHLDLERWFGCVYGSELDGTRTGKADLLAHVLRAEGLCPGDAAMVGDRLHDVLGARANGIAAVGVTYGFGSAEELREAGAVVLCDSPAEVAAFFCPAALGETSVEGR
jgi:phosphoglycolate phosphatase